MRVFKNAWFARFARKQKISDSTLVETVWCIERGQIHADLGAGVIKQRIARPGRGKSSGYRTIILYRREQRAFFVYGFAKNERDNIDKVEEIQFKKAAEYVLGLSEQHLAALIHRGQFSEIDVHDEEIPQ